MKIGVHDTPPLEVVARAPMGPKAYAKLPLSARMPVNPRLRLEPTAVHVWPASVERNIAPPAPPATASSLLANAAALMGALPNDTNEYLSPPSAVRTRPVLCSATIRHKLSVAQRILGSVIGGPASPRAPGIRGRFIGAPACPVARGLLVHMVPPSFVFRTVEPAPTAYPWLASTKNSEFRAAPPLNTVVQLPAPLVVL